MIDGDQRMWLRVATSESVVILDYRGAPYLRFSRSGVAVNHNSAMYYLNQTPAEVPPSNLEPARTPRWLSVSGGHEYSWHDGRLHALATVRWRRGRRMWAVEHPGPDRWSSGPILGGLWHRRGPVDRVVLADRGGARVHVGSMAGTPSRARSVRRPRARDRGAGCDRGCSRRAGSFMDARRSRCCADHVRGHRWACGLGLRRVLFQHPGYFSFFVISFLALWEGTQLIPTLLDGFVLAAVPAFVARTAAVVCLGCGVGLLLVVFRLVDQGDARFLRR